MAIPPHLPVAELASLASALYRDGTVRGLIQALRPHICPYDVLIPIVRDGMSVLDIGCGAGLFLALLVRSGRRIRGWGLDRSTAAIAMAKSMRERRLSDEERGRLEFSITAGETDWPERKFDLVSMIDILHHAPPYRQGDLLRAAAARVAPGGALLYKDMAPRPLWRALMNRLHDLILAREWIHHMPVAQVERIAGECGLRLARAESIHRIWYAHELRLFRAP
jgi:2-polyprenyl-3-methyl-5-hydroxy-6-metoxy-1,4-benzoquinol methylase